jgi:signal peptidase I
MRRTVRDGVILLFCTLLFATGLKSCIIDAFKIPTASMEPALAVGDYLHGEQIHLRRTHS